MKQHFPDMEAVGRYLLHIDASHGFLAACSLWLFPQSSVSTLQYWVFTVRVRTWFEWGFAWWSAGSTNFMSHFALMWKCTFTSCGRRSSLCKLLQQWHVRVKTKGAAGGHLMWTMFASLQAPVWIPKILRVRLKVLVWICLDNMFSEIAHGYLA